MKHDELVQRLKNGEKVKCPECEHFLPYDDSDEDSECDIICCEDPFKGPAKFEASRHVESIKTYFDMQKPVRQ